MMRKKMLKLKKKKKSLRELQSRSKMICEYGTFKLHVIIFFDIKVLISTFSYRNYCGCGVICTILQQKEKRQKLATIILLSLMIRPMTTSI